MEQHHTESKNEKPPEVPVSVRVTEFVISLVAWLLVLADLFMAVYLGAFLGTTLVGPWAGAVGAVGLCLFIGAGIRMAGRYPLAYSSIRSNGNPTSPSKSELLAFAAVTTASLP